MKLIRKHVLLKAFAVFFLLEIITSTVVPAVSWALTSGPTAPEFSSFEPVDTSDMVNLSTGELIYNMPLLEVPGPAGGYPLSLSYHAGIKPDQEASWVGLGVTLNPGAINRTVNGFADDNFGARREVRDYWDGGQTTTKTKTLGFSMPQTGIGVNYTTERTQDTFKGFSVNGYTGVDVNLVSAGVGIANGASGIKPDDNARVAMNSHASGIKNLDISATLQFSIASSGVKSSMTVAGQRLNNKTENRSGGMSQINRVTRQGAVGFSIGPLFAGSFAIRDFYRRYWSDQSDAIYSYGSLYPEGSVTHDDHYALPDGSVPPYRNYPYSEFITYTGDTYDLPETPHSSIYNPSFPYPVHWDQGDPTRQIGGSLPSNDQYVVTGQGVGGMIEPYTFENPTLHGQNTYFKDPLLGGVVPGTPVVNYRPLHNPTPGKRLDFRFKNDFSNSMTMDIGSYGGGSGAADLYLTPGSKYAAAQGYDETPTRQKLAGSRDIQWFTVSEIKGGTEAKNKGFIDCYASPGGRASTMQIYNNYMQPDACLAVPKDNLRGRGNGIFITDSYPEEPWSSYNATYVYPSLKPRTINLDKKIGGFMVTNESGVTYHYALPAYSYNEYTRTKLKKPQKGVATINEIRNDEPYAYTWLLTAITGPDFVDRGGTNGAPNGILDDQDYGYWVRFDYGKWTDSYQWRTPQTGYATDFESEYETFSYGIKELYYLDAIETKTHKALFVKSKRKDARGVTSRLEGGSNPRRFKMKYKFSVVGGESAERGALTFSVSPVSTLKLDAIYLFDKKDMTSYPPLKSLGDKYDNAPISSPHWYAYQGTTYTFQNPDPNTNYSVTINSSDGIPVKYHNGDLVLDDEDMRVLEGRGFTPKNQALQIIELGTDYSLCPGVPNSFNYMSYYTPVSCTGSQSCPSADLDFEWPILDQYCFGNFPRQPDCCNADDKKAFYSYNPLETFGYVDINLGSCAPARSNFAGAAMTYSRPGKLTLKSIRFMGEGGVSLIPEIKFAYNADKNPAYQLKSQSRRNGKHFYNYDDWGYYKSDYAHEAYSTYDANGQVIESGEWEGTHRITPASAQNVDAWSLTEVTLPTGGKMKFEYEPNIYRESVYNNGDIFSIEKIERVSGEQVRMYFKEKNINLFDFFSVGKKIGLKVFLVSDPNGSMNKPYCDLYSDFNYPFANIVKAVNSDNIVVEAPTLNEWLTPGRSVVFDLNSYPATTYFVAGCASVVDDTSTEKLAGGIRVRSITVDEFGGHQVGTSYIYTNGRAPSGVTSYKPFHAITVNFPTEIPYFEMMAQTPDWDENKYLLLSARTKFQHILNSLYFPILLFSSEAPAPGAIYDWVRVYKTYDGMEVGGETRYTFKVFDADMIKREPVGDDLRKLTLTNTAADVGNLLSVEHSSENGVVLSEARYGYLYDEEDEAFEVALKNKRQGIVEQIYNKYVHVIDYKFNGVGNVMSELSNTKEYVQLKRVERANVLTKLMRTDRRLTATDVTEYVDFDFYSGQSVSTVEYDGLGNRILTKVKPAYRVSEYAGTSTTIGMGLKLKNPKNKHMLTQEAETTVYQVDGANNYQGILSATTQTWSNEVPSVVPESNGRVLQLDVWRRNAEYTFVGTSSVGLQRGLYPVANFAAFSSWASSSSIAPTWQRQKETTLFDVYSHSLEGHDMNDSYGAVRMTYDLQRVLAVVNNARYNEVLYTGFEGSYRPGDGTFAAGQGTFGDETAIHTGRGCLALPAGGVGAIVTLPINNFGKDERGNNRNVDVSFWLHAQNTPALELQHILRATPEEMSRHAVDLSVAKQAGDWYLCTFTIPMTAMAGSSNLKLQLKNLSAGVDVAYIDDLRVHPTDATMVSYVYDYQGRLSHVLDENNIYKEFTYDAAGRLVETWQESFQYGSLRAKVKTADVKYRYSGQNE